MSKGINSKKATKKAPLMTPKEKKDQCIDYSAFVGDKLYHHASS